MVRQAPKRPPVSEAVGRWAKDASLRASGAMFSLLAAALALALLSYSVSDPSWSTATAREATNWMGPDGAAAADVVLQMIGIGCVVLIAPVAMWGAWLAWRGMPERTPLAGWVRLYGAPVAALLIAGFASALPAPASWPFMTGLGGVLGDGVASALTSAAAAIGAPSPRGLAAAFALCLGAPLAMFAIGVRRRDLREGAAGARRFWAMLTNGAERAVAWRAERLATAGGEDRSLLSAALRAADRPLEADEDISADEPVAASFIVERPAPAATDDDRPKRQILRNEDQPKPQSAREKREAQAKFKFLSGGAYELPPLSLLAKPKEQAGPTVSDEALEQNARLLEGVLSDFGVRGEIINVRPGPVVTLYELEPAAGVKSSRVIGLADDIARSMSAVAARVAVVPGRNVIGIELPNLDRETVYLRESLSEPDYEQSPGGLALALGKSIGGEPVVADLARMPHLLIAGTTGSG
ncbi:MAG: DNA translocase FtsK 4TM domain-containing protein, partial [Pseudomonadota bacterium]